MASCQPPLPMKIEVTFQPRDDGGLRAFCESLPGFVMSHSNAALLLADVEPVLETMLSSVMGCRVVVTPMIDVAEALGVHAPQSPVPLEHREYVGTPIAA